MKIEIHFQFTEDWDGTCWDWFIEPRPEDYTGRLTGCAISIDDAMQDALDAKEELSAWHWSKYQLVLF